MKKLLYFLLVSLLLVSCKDDFDISKLQDTPRLVVYCFPTVGDTTMIVVTKSVPITTAKGDREQLCRYPVDAHVTYQVNGVEYPVKRIASVEEARRFSASDSNILLEAICLQMVGQYYAIGKQKAGDNISVEVSAEGFQPVSAATYIPQSVKVGINELSFEEANSGSGLDQILASFDDNGASKDYYSVKVMKTQTIGAAIGIDPSYSRYEEPVYVYDAYNYKAINEETPGMIWNFDSLFQVSSAVSIDTEKEPVFKHTTKIDEDLGFDDYSYYALAYIFDDHLFNGKEYTLHLNLSSIIYGNNYYYSGWDTMYGYAYGVEFQNIIVSSHPSIVRKAIVGLRQVSCKLLLPILM